MVKKVIKTNPNLIELINKLYEQSRNEDAAIWKDVAQRLERSNRRTAEVNLSDIARYAEAGIKVGVTGSFGFACREILCDIGTRHGLEFVKFIKSPVDGLVTYHKK